MKVTTYTAWAIESRSTNRPSDENFLCGRYYGFTGEIPAYMEGHKFAAFKTRRLALEARPENWNVGKNKHWYVVVKVKVTVEVEQ